MLTLFPIIIMIPLNSFYCFSPLHENANANGIFFTSPTSRPPPERQLANTMTSSSSLPPNVSGISKELAELRHLVQFPEEIACILTEQEQQLYQQVGTLVKKSHCKYKYVIITDQIGPEFCTDNHYTQLRQMDRQQNHNMWQFYWCNKKNNHPRFISYQDGRRSSIHFIYSTVSTLLSQHCIPMRTI